MIWLPVQASISNKIEEGRSWNRKSKLISGFHTLILTHSSDLDITFVLHSDTVTGALSSKKRGIANITCLWGLLALTMLMLLLKSLLCKNSVTEYFHTSC